MCVRELHRWEIWCDTEQCQPVRVVKKRQTTTLVVEQRSVKEKEWLESFRVFGIGKEDGKKIVRKLGLTLLNEHEKLFAIF